MDPAASKISFIARAVFILIWAGVIIACITAFFLHPEHFTAENIAAVLSRFKGEIWVVYSVLCILRGFTLLPSTPLVIAGTILFPEQPVAVVAVSLIGIILSSTMIYYFSDLLGFTDFFENRYPDFIHRTKRRLDHPAGFAFVSIWAFFPLVPTDAVCYAAGTSKMKFWKFILAITIGELALVGAYVYSGNYLRRLLQTA